MKGLKIAIAVLTIIEAVQILGAIGLMWLLGAAMGSAGGIGPGYFSNLAAFTGIVLGFVAAGIFYLVLGIKFLSNKPNKGIAITLLVINVLFVIALLGSSIFLLEASGDYGVYPLTATLSSASGFIMPIIKLVILIMYLKQLSAQSGAFDWNSRQPAGGTFCGNCGARREFADKCCKNCGGHL